MMRRFMVVYGLVCLLALGGWGHTLAAAACAHAAGASAATRSQDHACCRARTTRHGAHHPASEHEAHTQTAEHSGTGGAFIAPDDQIRDESESFCAHCMSSPAPAPLAGAVRAQQTQKDAGALPALHVGQTDATDRVRVAPLAPQQHAPPGRDRHLLLSTLLI